MPAILTNTSAARERLNDATACAHQVKATLDPHTPACDLRSPAADALRWTTKQEAAAETIGLSQSRLSHKYKDGTLTIAQLERLGIDYAVAFAKEVLERYGPLASSPAARVRIKTKELRAVADELDQLADFISEVA